MRDLINKKQVLKAAQGIHDVAVAVGRGRGVVGQQGQSAGVSHVPELSRTKTEVFNVMLESAVVLLDVEQFGCIAMLREVRSH